MLPSERNADNRDAKQQAKGKMGQTNPESAYKYPDNIHQQTQASTRTSVVDDRFSEWP